MFRPSRRTASIPAFIGLLLVNLSGLAAVVHEWNFNETSGTTLFDSIGTAHAQIVVIAGGGGYQLDGKRVRLDGGTRSNADFVLFPENTFDGLTDVSVEVWAIPHSFPNWGRVFEIGPGDGGDPNLNLIRVAFSQGIDGDAQRYGLYGLTPLDATQLTPVDREYHYVMTWSAGGQLSFYRDGVFLGSQNTSPRNIQTLAALTNTTFWLGRSHITGDSTANASYNKIRVYDTVLDAATIAANFRRGADDTFGLLHRWAFSETVGPNLADSVGTATGSVASPDGVPDYLLGSGQITLLGGSRTSADYVSFPPRRFDGLTNTTVEIWATPNAAMNWSRVFDIGDGATPATSFFLSFTRGTDLNLQRLEYLPAGGTADSALPTQTGTQYHYVVVWNNDLGRCDWYRNGQLVGGFNTGSQTLASVSNAVFWLGRSHYAADQTAAASYNDVRVYNRALFPAEILFRYQQGPDSTAIAPPVAVDDAITLNPGAMALVPVLKNDQGIQFNPDSLTIVTNPSSGTAQVKPDGKILYTHNGGPATSDQFSYTVQDAFGSTSSAGTVFITISSALRLPNTTITVPNTPPPVGYAVVDAFPNNPFFEDALALQSPPGSTNLLFVAERRGIISYVDVTQPSPTRQVLLDIRDQVMFDTGAEGEMGLLGFDFHPGFATNGLLFVAYTALNPRQDRLSRFTANPTTLTVDTNTQQILFSVVDEAFNHNGSDVHFGPDGYLYMSMGDEGDQYNFRQNAQRIDKDFYSGILRIDVDRKPGNVEPNPHSAIPTNGSGQAFYRIPIDNPYVHTSLGGTWNGVYYGQTITNLSAVRGEFFATGLRHPWRFWVDRTNGDVWVGDVGQDRYEEVNLVTNGGNYGWAYYEGTTLARSSYPSQVTLPTNPPPGLAFPLYTYSHTSQGGDPNFAGNAVIGGVIYRGSRLPELNGAYVFGDFPVGGASTIWALRRTNSSVIVQRIAADQGVAAFGFDPGNGDVLIAAYGQNKVKRLVHTEPASNFPQKLSDTGVFADLATLTPNPGIVSYDPKIAFWSDYALKRRWFVIPDLTNTVTFAADSNWTLPAGMKWIKHFDLETERGNSNSPKRRLETRILVKTTTGTYGVSYKWNDAQDEAFLVGDGGTNFNVAVTIGGVPTNQLWEIPSRGGCIACHTVAGGHALTFNTREMNNTANLDGIVGNCIDVLSQAGYFSGPVPAANTLPVYAKANDDSASLEFRARSYLAVNCVQCHQPGGAAAGTWDARPYLTLAQTGLINTTPTDDGGDPANKIIAPGNLAHSVLWLRIQGTNGFSRMPPLATHQLDVTAIQLIADWITQDLPTRLTYAQWIAQYPSVTGPNAQPGADPDGDGAINQVEYLTGTDPTNPQSAWRLGISAGAALVNVSYPRVPNLGVSVENSSNLFLWSLWNVPGNQPFFGSSTGTVLLQGPLSTNPPFQYFRARLIEP